MAFRDYLATMVPFKRALASNARYADMDVKETLASAGTVLVFSTLIALAAAVLLYTEIALWQIAVVAVVVALGPQAVMQLVVGFRADKRGAHVDAILPDALQLISANVRSGMTVDRAIWLSARPEFGPLREEIKRVSTEVMGAVTIGDALSGMTERIKSKSLDRAVKLIKEGLKGGGEIAKLLDHVATDIRNFQSMVEEAKASTTTYTMFIIMAAVIGAPLLFGISTYFIEIIEKIFASRVIPTDGASFTGALQVSGPQVSSAMIRNFAVVALVTITFFASLIIGLIRTGEEKNGLRFAPLLIGASLLAYFTVKAVVGSVFGSII